MECVAISWHCGVEGGQLVNDGAAMTHHTLYVTKLRRSHQLNHFRWAWGFLGFRRNCWLSCLSNHWFGCGGWLRGFGGLFCRHGLLVCFGCSLTSLELGRVQTDC